MMADSEPDDPIADGEFLHRWIPMSQGWFDRTTGKVDPNAFRPTENDLTGLSLGRAKYASAESEAAKGRLQKEYAVAIVCVADLKRAGISVVRRPLPDDPGHVEIPALTYANRKSLEARNAYQALLKAVSRVDGPFPGMVRPPEPTR